ncbi:calcium-binding protein, partial [Brevundimonas sp.]|uniref:beta strand repeat-containing protein n=1 Tax=Brevundimonas sp. TaxID=1871086 RepID=UPI002D36AAEA
MATINGTGAPETLPGTADADDIHGFGGNDVINGGGGGDLIEGGDGADYLNHNTSTDYRLEDGSADSLYGGAGNDVIDVGAFDAADGGDGIDRITFYSTQNYYGSGGVNWDLTGVTDVNAWLNSTFSGWLTVSNFEQIGLVGTDGGDVIIGNDLDPGLSSTMEGYGGADRLEGRGGRDELYGGDGDDILRGDDGDDVVDGGAGNDDIQGGAGFDMFYTRVTGVDPLAVTIDLTIATAQDTGAGNDTISGVEQLRGFAAAANQTFHFLGDASSNLLIGSLGADTLDGRDSNDILRGGAGADALIGGNGFDEASYFGSDAGVSIDLTANTASGGYAQGDTFSGIENVNATEFSDSLTGDGLANRFVGNGGVDTLNGLAGADSLVGGAGADVINGGDDNDQIWSHVQNETSADNAVDVIDGGGGNDNITVGEGDIAEGGSGTDQAFASFHGRGSAITLDMSAGAEAAIEALGGFQLSGFEAFHVTGTAFGDQITGSAVGELINGGEGDDALIGGGGLDTLLGGLGNDSLDGGVANDMLRGGFGDDTYYLDDAGDAALEFANEGVDEVRTALASHTLAANVENLAFTSAANHTGVGNASGNVLTGHDGDDTLTGAGGDDIINGGAGSDTAVLAGNRADWTVNHLPDGVHVFNGTETNILTGVEFLAFADGTFPVAAPNIIDGTEDGDTLAGDDVTPAVDIIHGLGGDDTLRGHGETDSLYGDAGFDIVFGGDGADHIEGGDDADTLHGEAGNDAVLGDAGDDVLHGEGGDDILTGGIGFDTLYGGEGDDDLDGGDGYDILHGAAGADTLVGGEGADDLSGGDDADILLGGEGGDTLVGEGGADHLEGGTDSDQLTGGAGADYLDGGAGIDHARYTTAVTFNLTTGVGTGDAAGDVWVSIEEFSLSEFNDDVTGSTAAERIYGGGGDDTLHSGGGGGFLLGMDGADHLVGGDGSENDYLMGEGGDDLIEGGAGMDLLEGGAGTDILDGGAGDDFATVFGGATIDLREAGSQFVSATEGWDTLISIENLFGYNGSVNFTGNSASNYLGGDSQDDVLRGMEGNDNLQSGDGQDNLEGGDGDDSLTAGGGADLMRGGAGMDAFYGGDGVDTADYSLAAGGVTASLLANAASNDGDGGSDTIFDVENLTGSSFADTLTGDANANTLAGGAGADSLNGGDGDDVLRGGAGVDVMTGGAGIDTVDYSLAAAGMRAQLNSNASTNDGDGGTDTFSGMENLTGSAFNDVLIGDGVANVLRGGMGADTLLGLVGNDTLWGGAGALNTLQGGLGDDVYVLEAADSITELVGEGTDTVDARINTYVLANNVERLIFGGTGNFAGTGNALANVITGGAGNDALRGRGGVDVLNGGLGIDTADYTLAAAGVVARIDLQRATNDGDGATDTYTSVEHLIGSNFNDTLIGGAGANVLMGGTGADTLLGLGGDDVLMGGSGGVNNQLQGGAGNDWYVLDAFDTCVELAGEGVDTVEARVGSYTLANHIENLVYTGPGKFVGNGNALDNVLTGGNLNDILRGKGGNDTIHGGLGLDEVQFRGAKADYTVTAEGSGYRVVDSVGGRDGSTWVDSVELLRFMTGNTTTVLSYAPPVPAPLEPAAKAGGDTAQVLPFLAEDDAFAPPAPPADQPLVLPGVEDPLVLPGTDEAPLFLALEARLAPAGGWIAFIDDQGRLLGDADLRSDDWM